MTKTTAGLKESDFSDEMIRKNISIFLQMGLQGTPAMLIGDQLLPGYIPYDRLKGLVQAQLEA